MPRMTQSWSVYSHGSFFSNKAVMKNLTLSLSVMDDEMQCLSPPPWTLSWTPSLPPSTACCPQGPPDSGSLSIGSLDSERVWAEKSPGPVIRWLQAFALRGHVEPGLGRPTGAEEMGFPRVMDENGKACSKNHHIYLGRNREGSCQAPSGFQSPASAPMTWVLFPRACPMHQLPIAV